MRSLLLAEVIEHSDILHAVQPPSAYGRDATSKEVLAFVQYYNKQKEAFKYSLATLQREKVNRAHGSYFAQWESKVKYATGQIERSRREMLEAHLLTEKYHKYYLAMYEPRRT